MSANKQEPIAAPHPDIQAGDDEDDDDAGGDGNEDEDDADEDEDGDADEYDEVAGGSGQVNSHLWTADCGPWTAIPIPIPIPLQSNHFTSLCMRDTDNGPLMDVLQLHCD